VGLLEVLRCPLLSLSITVSNDIITSFYAQLALFQKMFSLLHQYHCSSLKALSINFPPSLQSPLHRDQVVIDTLALLSSFSSFANLTFLTPFSQHLDDAWFAQAVGSWSRLKNISIADFGPPLGPPNFSLKGIIPMIKQCPQLVGFGLRLDLMPVPIPLLVGVCNPHVRTLFFSPGSNLIRPDQVLCSWIIMFPNLKDIFGIRVPEVPLGKKIQRFRDLLRRTWSREGTTYDAGLWKYT
jgi:hypothetical protein